jgi:hypothetical protein
VIFAGDTQRMQDAQWGFRFAYREVTASVVTLGAARPLLALIARILGSSLLPAGLGAGLGLLPLGQYDDSHGIALVPGCVGAIIGAAREIASALHERPRSSPPAPS